jgi:two-component system sensor histidine kinase/response regulator
VLKSLKEIGRSAHATREHWWKIPPVLPRQVAPVVVATVLTMTAYETLKTLLFPHLTLIESHAMTIGVAAVASFFCADWSLRRKMMVAEAIAATTAKSAFLSTMSHEIRTPMNAVLGMADLLHETELSQEQRRYLEVMIANGNALLDLINGILDLARIESGRLQLEKIEFALTDLLDETISTFGPQAHGKGLELAARIAPSVPDHLLGDPLRIRQILINLIGNAIKFTEVGQIIVEIDHDSKSNDPEALRFTVSDTGIGIPPEKLNSIFASFTQVDSSTTREYGGSGLGLTIAERLVKLMNGRIWVESAQGVGSKFSFVTSLARAAQVISSTQDAALSLAGYRVLVVDDNSVNRLIVREMISACGAMVAESADGEEALAAIREAGDQRNPFKIVLLDMRMPGMDGLEVARRIREEKLPCEPLMLMLSSDDLSSQRVRVKELRLRYLIKPLTRKGLFDAIRTIIVDADRTVRTTLPDPHPKVPAAPHPANGASPIRILVAEDSPDNRLVIAAYLRLEPYQIEFAKDGQEAVQKFTSGQYEIVLMDVQMPKLDGLAATRLMREWEKDQGRLPIPIIALSASVLGEDVHKAIEAGCNVHVAKPVKKAVLLQVIRQWLADKGNLSASPQGSRSPTLENAA